MARATRHLHNRIAVVFDFDQTLADDSLDALLRGLGHEPEAFRREQVQPLTSPPEGIDPAVADAARRASTDAFHLAMLVSAGLLVAGATINAVGIRNPPRAPAAEETTAPAAAG